MLGHRLYDIEIFTFGAGVPSTTFHTMTLSLSFYPFDELGRT